MDTIILRDLPFELSVGLDAWRRPAKRQPVLVTLNLQPEANFEAAALQDDVGLTLDYGKLYKSVNAKVKDQAYGSVQGLMLALAQAIPGYKLLNVDITMPKAILQADGGLHYHLRIDRSVPEMVDATWSVAIKHIACSCIIGVNPHERLFKQKLYFDVILGGAHRLDPATDGSAVSGASLLDLVDLVVAVS